MPGKSDTRRDAPFYEHPWFKGGAALVGLIGAVWALTGAPKLWDVAEDISATRFPLNNTAIVLDGSAGMEKSFASDRTKLDAAVDAVGDYVAPFGHEGLALLRSGGSCGDDGEVLVDFGEGHQDEVREAAAEVDPGGRSNLGNAVLAALDQFSDSERFGESDGLRRVVVFTGGGDQCIGEQAAARIRRELARTGIETVFNLVALKVPKAERGQLSDFTKALGGRAVVEFVENDDELDDSVERAKVEALTAEEAPPPPAGEELGRVPYERVEAEPETEAEGEAEVDDSEGGPTTTTEGEEAGSAREGESTIEPEGESIGEGEGAAEAESEAVTPPGETARPPPTP